MAAGVGFRNRLCLKMATTFLSLSLRLLVSGSLFLFASLRALIDTGTLHLSVIRLKSVSA